MDVDEIADRLYALVPEEFTPARDAAAKEAADPDLRKAIKALRKPTAGAYAVNRLVRDQTNHVDRLLALGEQMREAMGGDAAEVRRLTEDRRSLITQLVDPDLPAAAQQDVTATLEAATADPDLGAAVRSGRLVKPLRYAGFGAMPDLDDAMGTPLRLVRAKPTASAETSSRATRPTRPAKETASSSKKTASKKKPAASKSAASPTADADLAAARQRCLDLAGIADDAQRRYELAVKAATEARRLLDEAEAERGEAHRAARAAHAEAEKARREVGRLERS